MQSHIQPNRPIRNPGHFRYPSTDSTNNIKNKTKPSKEPRKFAMDVQPLPNNPRAVLSSGSGKITSHYNCWFPPQLSITKLAIRPRNKPGGVATASKSPSINKGILKAAATIADTTTPKNHHEMTCPHPTVLLLQAGWQDKNQSCKIRHTQAVPQYYSQNEISYQ